MYLVVQVPKPTGDAEEDGEEAVTDPLTDRFVPLRDSERGQQVVPLCLTLASIVA